MKAKSEKRRPFIGDQIEECRDASGLFYILGFQKVRYLVKRCKITNTLLNLGISCYRVI